MSRRKTSLTDTVITSCQIRCKNKIACLIRNSIPKGLCCIWWHSNVIIYYSVCTSWVGFQHLTGAWSNKPPPTQTLFFFKSSFRSKFPIYHTWGCDVSLCTRFTVCRPRTYALPVVYIRCYTVERWSCALNRRSHSAVSFKLGEMAWPNNYDSYRLMIIIRWLDPGIIWQPWQIL